MDADEFLAQLTASNPEDRQSFTLDLHQAQAKMGGHLAFDYQDYTCHFFQLACLQGAPEVHLKVQPHRLEWSFSATNLPSGLLQEAVQARAGLNDLEQTLTLCLKAVSESPYSEKRFYSGSQVLTHRSGKGWTTAQAPPGPTRIQISLPWSQLAQRLRQFRQWWAQLPEVQRLLSRTWASPLPLRLPSPLPPPNRHTRLLRIEGDLPLSLLPPSQADHIDNLKIPGLPASAWLSGEGSQLEILSDGLAYAVPPSLAPAFHGSLWVNLGSLKTDLSRSQLIDDDLLQRRWHDCFERISASFSALAGDEYWNQWLIRWLMSERGESLRQNLAALPLFASAGGQNRLTLNQLDQATRARKSLDFSFERLHQAECSEIVLVDQALLDELAYRYPVPKVNHTPLPDREASDLGPPFDIEAELAEWPYHQPFKFGMCWGYLAFQPNLRKTQISMLQNGRRVQVISPAVSLLEGFHLIVDHPQFRPVHPKDLPRLKDWNVLQEWLRTQQVPLALQWCHGLPLEDRTRLAHNLVSMTGLDIEAALDVPLLGEPGSPTSTLRQLLNSGHNGQLDPWLEAGVALTGPLTSFLTSRLGVLKAGRAFALITQETDRNLTPSERPARAAELPLEDYILTHRQQGWAWGLLADQDADCRIEVYLDQRPMGRIRPKWDLAIRAWMRVEQLQRDSKNEILMAGEVAERWEEIRAQLAQSFLEQTPEDFRLIQGFRWVRDGNLPGWAQPLIHQPLLQDGRQSLTLHQWCSQARPWPYVREQGPRPEPPPGVFLPLLPPALEAFSEGLRDYDEWLRQLETSAPESSPHLDYQFQEGPFTIGTSTTLPETILRLTWGGRPVRTTRLACFPPVYLEQQLAHPLAPPVPIPKQYLEPLWQWWRRQLQDPQDWLWELEPLLEKAHHHAISIPPDLAELAQRALQRLNQASQPGPPNPLRLVRTGLRIMLARPFRLRLETGESIVRIETDNPEGIPVVHVHLEHPALLGKDAFARTGALLTLLALENPGAGNATSTLLQFPPAN